MLKKEREVESMIKSEIAKSLDEFNRKRKAEVNDFAVTEKHTKVSTFVPSTTLKRRRKITSEVTAVTLKRSASNELDQSDTLVDSSVNLVNEEEITINIQKKEKQNMEAPLPGLLGLEYSDDDDSE